MLTCQRNVLVFNRNVIVQIPPSPETLVAPGPTSLARSKLPLCRQRIDGSRWIWWAKPQPSFNIWNMIWILWNMDEYVIWWTLNIWIFGIWYEYEYGWIWEIWYIEYEYEYGWILTFGIWYGIYVWMNMINIRNEYRYEYVIIYEYEHRWTWKLNMDEYGWTWSMYGGHIYITYPYDMDEHGLSL